MKNIDSNEILKIASECKSINDLGRKLNCTGTNKGNMNGRDLRKIRKIIGFKKYAMLSGGKHHVNSFYYKVWEKSDDHEKEEFDRQIKKYGVITDAKLAVKVLRR